MAYVDVKNQFVGLLNRRDITPTLTNIFMDFGVQRIKRELRLPSMEKVVAILTDGSANIPVPGDLLEVISIHTNDPARQNRLERTDLQTILQQARVPGNPRYYFRQEGTFTVGPYPPQNTAIYVHYYLDTPGLSADTDSNWITQVAPTLLVYAALSYACDYYLDDRKALFENNYQQIADQLQNQALQDEIVNASISPAYDSNPNYVGPFYGW